MAAPRSAPQSTTSAALEELVASAAGGDRGAQELLLTRFWPVIRQVVRARKRRLGRQLAGREDTADLEQSAALQLLTSLGAHRWQGGSAFVAWIKALARHRVGDVARRHRAGKRSSAREVPDAAAQAAPWRSAESLVDEHRRLERLSEQIAGLKPEYGAALTLFHLGFALDQIGAALGCSAEAARKLVARARVKLLSADEPASGAAPRRAPPRR